MRSTWQPSGQFGPGPAPAAPAPGLLHRSYGSAIDPAQGLGTVRPPRRPEPAQVRGAARLRVRRRTPGPGRCRVRVRPRHAGIARPRPARGQAEPVRRGRPAGPQERAEKDRARARVIELRREGLSVYEISTRLAAEGTPLNRTGVGQVLAEEGFGRLLRGPDPAASTSPATSGRDTRLPRTAIADFTALPGRVHTSMAGLLLAIPDLVALDLPALILTGTRRVSHAGVLITEPAAALFAGLSVLPKKTALTDYSYATSHDHQRAFLSALDTKMIASRLATSDEAIFDLDFHAVMHWGSDPALEKHYVPTRS